MYKYDLFEKFPDGSSLWRACVLGRRNARAFLLQWAKQSKHQFYAMNVKTAEVLSLKLKGEADSFMASAAMTNAQNRRGSVA